jgi:NarL family two-component system sensor histidine kinase LiaS
VGRLGRLAENAEAWGRGDFSVVADDSEADELGELARRLNWMAVQLEQLVEMRLDLAVLKERNRMARDLHDSVKQLAFGAAAQIGTARTLIECNPAEASSHIDEAERLTHELRQELSSLILELAPPAIENKGLAFALHEYSQSWSRQNNIEIEVKVKGEPSLPIHIAETLFRIAQEALANAARHSKAGHVDINLSVDGNTVLCVVEDDGVGFDPENHKQGFGLNSMADRAGALGGELNVTSVIGGGTRVVARLPIDEWEQEPEGEEYG